MKTNIRAITLAVSDLERSLRFYRDGLGLSSSGIIGTEFVRDTQHPGGSVAMFTLDNDLILSLYSRIDLAMDAGIDLERVTGSPIGLGFFADSREEVDHILQRAEQAGGSTIRPPVTRPWGIYAGYFADPDGHLWEAVYFLAGRPA